MNIGNFIQKVLVIDNKYDEISLLIKYLNTEKVNYTFCDASVESFPSTPYDDFDMIILDINLTAATSNSDKMIKSTLQGVLNTLIAKNAKPYLLLIWSKKEHHHLQIVKEVLAESEFTQPIAIESLEKNIFFNQEGQAKNAGKDKLEAIVTKVFKKYPEFQLISWWGKKSSVAATSTIKDFFSSNRQKKWHEETLKKLFMLANSYSGLSLVPATKSVKSNQAYSEAACLMLSEVYKDKFVDELIPAQYTNLTKKISNRSYDEDELRKINYNLHFGKAHFAKFHTGNAYANLNFLNKKEFLLKTLKTDKNELEDAAYTRITKDKDVLFFEIIVTPLCDFAQQKYKFLRIVPMVFLPPKYLKGSLSENYYDLGYDIKYNNIDYRCIIDVSMLFSIKESDFLEKKKKNKPTLRLKHQLVYSIQNKISQHQSRYPILKLDSKKNLEKWLPSF